MQKEAYFLEVARYVVLNPVRARMVHTSEERPWSSYQAMIGLQTAPDWLETCWILAAFGPTEEQAVRAYMRFVAEGEDQPSPWEQLKNQVFLGKDAFVESMRGKAPGGGDLRAIPLAKLRAKAKPIAHYARRLATRNQAIIAAYASGGIDISRQRSHRTLVRSLLR